MYETIINPIAGLLGKVMDIVFTGLTAVGLGNIAIAIIVFTIIVKLCMLPLTIKQSKTTKLNSVIQPEIRAIQDKYRGKTGDQTAAMKMQEETKMVYEKYGTSPMGGCWQMLIQLPILMALYGVFRNTPIYITEVKNHFINILGNGNDIKGIMNTEGFADYMSANFSNMYDWTNLNDSIIGINSLTVDQWEQLKNHFTEFSDIIASNFEAITEMNTFFGINVSQIPTFALNAAILIPILAGVSQYISTRVLQGDQQIDDDNPAAASMKMMTVFMPLMSVFFAFSLPAGLGLYWIATAVITTIIQVIVNRHYDKIGVDEIVKKNIEKRNKKRAKKGLPPQQLAKNATASTKNVSSIDKNKERIERLNAKKEANDQKIKELKEAAANYSSAKPGSLAEKANMVARYNEMNKK